MNFTVFSFPLIISFWALLFTFIAAYRLFQVPIDVIFSPFVDAIKKGAFHFLKKQSLYISGFVGGFILLLSIALSQGYDSDIWYGVWLSVSFLCGILTSGLAGVVSMIISTRANVIALQRLQSHGTHAGFLSSFHSAAIMGFFVASLALLGVIMVFLLFWHVFGIDDIHLVLSLLVGFGLGASALALFARIGGGIYTKASDIASDLVGKIEMGLAEDDVQNPATIANNVGDNVGDIAGMGADLFESYVGSLISALILGYMQFKTDALFFVFVFAACGIIASAIGLFFVRIGRFGTIHTAMKNGLWISSLSVVLFGYFLSEYFFSGKTPITEISDASFSVFMSLSLGVLVGVLMDVVTEYYTSERFAPVKELAENSRTGAVMNILSGLIVGFRSTFVPLVLIALAILFSYAFAGLFGIAVAALGMLSTLGITFAIGAYGPVVDNAKGIAQMAKLEESLLQKTDVLDMVGNTSAAMGKGFAIGSTALTALALFAAYSLSADIFELDILDSRVLIGLFLGCMIPFLFSAFTLTSVRTVALQLMDVIRSQCTSQSYIQKGINDAHSQACLDQATTSSLHNMMLPSLFACFMPLVTGFLFGSIVLGGLLVGSLISGVLMAFFMTHAGGAWDNAKKYITASLPEEPTSKIYKASMLGDAIGDPLKDVSGPSLNILIKVMMVLSLLFGTVFSANGVLGILLSS